jgi:NAD(P)-dependent dehydrogenase (short-subunit alcohol dehydrogenase family)
MLKNKVAIVTGAKQGIGYGIAAALAKEGCKVVVSDISQKDCDEAVKKLEKDGGEGYAVQCDVSKRSDVDKLISETVKKFGKLDIIVNNAGIYPFVPFEKMKEEDWDKVMGVNMKGVFNCTQSALKEMKEGARIINISSIASMVGFEGLVHYCASKGGVNGFTRALALELAARRITVNAVCPGAIETPGATGAMDEKMKEQTAAAIPAKRYGKPEDIANAVVFLALDQSSYVTGQAIVVDGGWTVR